MYARFLENKLKASQLPVIFINGARQVGKSTLVKKIFEKTHDYYTLDNPQILSLVRKDPLNFVRFARNPIIIDEVQRCPEVLLAIKTLVDEKRIPQQFILTGSVNILRISDVSDSLAGRMGVYSLWPLSMEEILGKQSDFLAGLFQQKISLGNADTSNLVFDIKKGGYPLSLLSENNADRAEWHRTYLEQVLGKDIRDLSNIEGLTEMPNILGLLASRAGSLLNLNDLSRSLQIPHTTLKRYLNLLEMSYLYCPLKPWFTNSGKRLIKSDKIYLNDTALIESILHRDIDKDPALFGHVLENFVAAELTKQISYKQLPISLYFYRTMTGNEVDFILEGKNGQVVGLEIKGASQFSQKDVKGLRLLKESLGEKFTMGLILYRGTQVLPIEENIYAVPLSYLWT
ncbi:MAG: ATP-binding protein [Pseudomonadota bacterium]